MAGDRGNTEQAAKEPSKAVIWSQAKDHVITRDALVILRRSQRTSICPSRTATAFAALASVLLFLACAGTKEDERKPTVNVRVAAATRAAIERTVKGEAVLYPLGQAAIVPKISAPVERFLVNRGSRVRKGQLLAVLEHSDLSAALAENRGSYEEAEANYNIATRTTLPQDLQKAELDLKAAREQFTQSQQVYDSRKSLYAQGALAKRDLDTAAVSLTQARNAFEEAQKHYDQLVAVDRHQQGKAARGQLGAAKGKYESAVAQLDYAEIRSPIDGVVTDRPLYPGEMASSGTPLITVMNISSLIARAHIPQSEAQLLKVGDPATITAPGASVPVNGKVTVVSPALDPGSTTVEVWIQTTNTANSLKPGTSVQFSVAVQTIRNALAIPKSALLTGDHGTTVMVVDPAGLAHQRSVEVGIQTDDQAQITKGLQEGEQVVTTGAFGLPDGVKVAIQTLTPAEGGAGKD